MGSSPEGSPKSHCSPNSEGKRRPIGQHLTSFYPPQLRKHNDTTRKFCYPSLALRFSSSVCFSALELQCSLIGILSTVPWFQLLPGGLMVRKRQYLWGCDGSNGNGVMGKCWIHLQIWIGGVSGPHGMFYSPAMYIHLTNVPLLYYWFGSVICPMTCTCF